MNTMIVNEIFYSLQGEGFLAGTPSVFIRLAGCPLRCRWCDTKYALDNNSGDNYNIEEIIKKVQRHETKYVVITGGEPMINRDLLKLAQKLKSLNKHITIETAGIVYIPEMPCDLMSISPKLSNSTPTEPHLDRAHENARLDLAVLSELIEHFQYQLKFVVDSQDDLPEIQQTIEQTGNIDSEKVMLMPQAATRDELLAKSPMVAEMCKQTGFSFCQRLQILLWDNAKGT